jgi:hypothetical protein
MSATSSVAPTSLQSFDYSEIIKRLIKYLVEGLAVALAAKILPAEPLDFHVILMLGLTAAFVFSMLDLFAPSVAYSARSGAGMGIGFGLVGFPKIA